MFHVQMTNLVLNFRGSKICLLLQETINGVCLNQFLSSGSNDRGRFFGNCFGNELELIIRRCHRIFIPQLIVMIFTNSQLLVEPHLDPLLAAKEETKRNKSKYRLPTNVQIISYLLIYLALLNPHHVEEFSSDLRSVILLQVNFQVHNEPLKIT